MAQTDDEEEPKDVGAETPEGEEGEEEREAKAEGEPAGAEAAQRVAHALGVETEEEKAKAVSDAEAPAETAQNRAARRREEALKRRKKAASARAVSPDEDDDAALSRDKNKRAKELLTKRREQAAQGPRPVALLPGEMVDDALARSANASWRWMKANSGFLQALVVGAIVAGGGFIAYHWFTETKSASASEELAAAVASERGVVMPEDKRSEEQKEGDTTKIFKTAEERNETALAAYKKVESDHPNTGPGLLAKLGEAGLLLDKREWAQALDMYQSLSTSTLAGADADVKGRCLEGIGFAKEGKGDIDGALATYKELEQIDAKGYKELGMYHQARLLVKKGDTEAAKALLKKVHEGATGPAAEGHPMVYLEAASDSVMREIDPSLAPSHGPLGGPKGNSLSPEEARRFLQKYQESSQKKEHH